MAVESCGREGRSLQGLLALHYLHVYNLDGVSACAGAQVAGACGHHLANERSVWQVPKMQV
jgi:hypothetical protein